MIVAPTGKYIISKSIKPPFQAALLIVDSEQKYKADLFLNTE